MLQMDALAMTIAGLTVVGSIIGILKFVSERPKRSEMEKAIDRSVNPIKEELNYIRGKVDEIADALPKRRSK